MIRRLLVNEYYGQWHGAGYRLGSSPSCVVDLTCTRAVQLTACPYALCAMAEAGTEAPPEGICQQVSRIALATARVAVFPAAQKTCCLLAGCGCRYRYGHGREGTRGSPHSCIMGMHACPGFRHQLQRMCMSHCLLLVKSAILAVFTPCHHTYFWSVTGCPGVWLLRRVLAQVWVCQCVAVLHRRL